MKAFQEKGSTMEMSKKMHQRKNQLKNIHGLRKGSKEVIIVSNQKIPFEGDAAQAQENPSVLKVHCPKSFKSPSYDGTLKKVPQSFPPLTRERKSNWARQENDTKTNLSLGYQSSLDSLQIKGGIVL